LFYEFCCNLIIDSQWCELESEMDKLFQEAVKKIPTGQ